MAAHVTLQEAFDHLGLEGFFLLGTSPADPRETDLQLKLDAAEARVLKHITQREELTDDDWQIVKAAILLECGALWRFRGDDTEGNGPVSGLGLSPSSVNLLAPFHDPPLA